MICGEQKTFTRSTSPAASRAVFSRVPVSVSSVKIPSEPSFCQHPYQRHAASICGQHFHTHTALPQLANPHFRQLIGVFVALVRRNRKHHDIVLRRRHQP